MLKAINIHAPAAESIESLDDNTVLISINNNFEELFPLKLNRNDPKILTVQFDDVTENKYYQGVIFKRRIDKETTLKILGFIEKNKEKNFIINCMAGRSRSGAVAQFISETYGHELKENFWKVSSPNNYVLYMLREKGEYIG